MSRLSRTPSAGSHQYASSNIPVSMTSYYHNRVSSIPEATYYEQLPVSPVGGVAGPQASFSDQFAVGPPLTPTGLPTTPMGGGGVMDGRRGGVGGGGGSSNNNNNNMGMGSFPVQHPRTASGAWSPHDDEALVRARARGENWQQIHRQFPGKTPNACRKRHERLMERRNADDFDSRKMEVLAREYMTLRREIWTPLAQRTGEKWTTVEQKCMASGLKNLQGASRAAARRERLEAGGYVMMMPYEEESGGGGSGGSNGGSGEPHSSSPGACSLTSSSSSRGHRGHHRSRSSQGSSQGSLGSSGLQQAPLLQPPPMPQQHHHHHRMHSTGGGLAPPPLRHAPLHQQQLHQQQQQPPTPHQLTHIHPPPPPHLTTAGLTAGVQDVGSPVYEEYYTTAAAAGYPGSLRPLGGVQLSPYMGPSAAQQQQQQQQQQLEVMGHQRNASRGSLA